MALYDPDTLKLMAAAFLSNKEILPRSVYLSTWHR